MHIRYKFDGGKVVNLSQSGSWEHRCYRAGLEQNLGKCWVSETWGKVTNSLPSQVFRDTAEKNTMLIVNGKPQKKQRTADDNTNTLKRPTRLQLGRHTVSTTALYNLMT